MSSVGREGSDADGAEHLEKMDNVWNIYLAKPVEVASRFLILSSELASVFPEWAYHAERPILFCVYRDSKDP